MIEEEYNGGGYKRYSWRRGSVDTALRWRQDDCKWAYYSQYKPDCTGNPNREHLVAFKEAFESGLHKESESVQRDFYNDTQNLYVMGGSENSSKSNKDVSGWRPSNTAVWCRYATENIQVKKKYALSVDRAEYDTLKEMLGYCIVQ